MLGCSIVLASHFGELFHDPHPHPSDVVQPTERRSADGEGDDAGGGVTSAGHNGRRPGRRHRRRRLAHVVVDLDEDHAEHGHAEEDDEGAVEGERRPDQRPVAAALQSAQHPPFILQLAVVAVQVAPGQGDHAHARKDEDVAGGEGT